MKNAAARIAERLEDYNRRRRYKLPLGEVCRALRRAIELPEGISGAQDRRRTTSQRLCAVAVHDKASDQARLLVGSARSWPVLAGNARLPQASPRTKYLFSVGFEAAMFGVTRYWGRPAYRGEAARADVFLHELERAAGVPARPVRRALPEGEPWFAGVAAERTRRGFFEGLWLAAASADPVMARRLMKTSLTPRNRRERDRLEATLREAEGQVHHAFSDVRRRARSVNAILVPWLCEVLGPDTRAVVASRARREHGGRAAKQS